VVSSLGKLKCALDFVFRVTGPLFVLLALGLIASVIAVHFMAIIPFYLSYASIGGILHLAISIFLTVGITFNYCSAILTNPGTAPLASNPVATAQIGNVKNPAKKWCKKCNRPKIARSHHCHICNKCVLKMDHHCPWIANCVGYHNHRYFVLFLLYLWMGCGYASLMAFVPFRLSSDFHEPWHGAVSRGTVIFCFVMAVAVFCAVGLLLVWQYYLIFTGQTTIEFYFNKTKASRARARGKTWVNPYDLGLGRNFQIFFGTEKGRFWCSWLMPNGTQPAGDGTNFPTRKSFILSSVETVQ